MLSSNLKTYMVVCTKGNDEPMKTAFEEPLRPDVGCDTNYAIKLWHVQSYHEMLCFFVDLVLD